MVKENMNDSREKSSEQNIINRCAKFNLKPYNKATFGIVTKHDFRENLQRFVEKDHWSDILVKSVKKKTFFDFSGDYFEVTLESRVLTAY